MGASHAPGHLWYTVGPASVGRHADLINAGATGARLTFSYGSEELQANRARMLARESAALGHPCLILADLPGTKVRLGHFDGVESVNLRHGETIRLIVADSADPREFLPVPQAGFVRSLRAGSQIIVGDGTAELEVLKVRSNCEVDCVAPVGGTIEQRRGLSVRWAGGQPSCLTEVTMQQLAAVLREPAFGGVILSFVRSAEELTIVRDAMTTIGRENLMIVAKIETEAALGVMPEICAQADVIVAARGDLALTLPWLELPGAVQAIADAARVAARPWVLATQLMEGLDHFTFPTRAEICDLAHWRNEGCAGALLARETAFGRQPVRSVECVRDIMTRWSSTRS